MQEASPSLIRPGATFDGLEVLEEIGHGAFARVYRAHDPLADRYVALKVIDPARWPDADEAREQILEEARLVARIDSPHVVRLLKVHPHPTAVWVFEMEYVNGGPLSKRIEGRGKLEPETCRRVFEALLHALDAAHRRGVLHHDIKPGNVLLTEEGGVKLADFGLGRLIADGDLSAASVARCRGTPFYMAPEIAMGGRGGPPADLWSLGVLLYEMLTGHRPFTARTQEALFFQIQNVAPPPLPDDVPSPLADITLACLAKAPSERPASAADLLKRMEAPTGLRLSHLPPARTPTDDATGLVGRSRELDALRTRLANARRGKGGGLLLLGETGIGKSALLEQLGREARAEGVRCLDLRVSPLGGVLQPLADVLRESLQQEGRLQPSLDATHVPHTATEVLARLRHTNEGVAGGDVPDPRSSRDVEIALTTLAKEQTVLLVIEDAQLCDHDDTRLLAGLAAALASAPVLILVAYTTASLDASDSSGAASASYYELSSTPHYDRLDVPPLEAHDVRPLLERVAGVPGLPAELVERIRQASDGIPLYALEFFRHLEASGEIERDGDLIRLTARWERSALPRRLKDMVTRRLAGLDKEDRTLLETAAVAGNTFQGAALAKTMGRPLLPVLRALQPIHRDRALVVPMERGYRFAHTLYQEAIYEEMGGDLRKELHRAWAETLETLEGEEAPPPETLGWHWEQAGDRARARPFLIAACAIAVRGSEPARAWRLARRAGLLDDDVSDAMLCQHFSLLSQLGASFTSAAETARADVLRGRLRSAVEAEGTEDQRRMLVVVQAWHDALRSSAIPSNRKAIEDAAAHLPSSIYQGHAWWLLGRAAGRESDFETAAANYERAVAAYEAAGCPERATDLLQPLASLHRAQGRLAAALPLLERATKEHLESGHGRPQAALARAMAVLTAAQLGRPEGTGEAMETPIHWLEKSGQGAHAAAVRVKQAQVFVAEGRIRDAWTALRRAEPLLREGTLTLPRRSLLILKADLEMTAGDWVAAERDLAEVDEASKDMGPIDQAVTDETRALLFAVSGEEERAAALIDRLLRRLAPTNEHLDLARVLVEAIHLRALGVDLSRTRTLLSELRDRVPPHPPLVARLLEIADQVFLAELEEEDAARLEDATPRLRDPRHGWHQATSAVAASLLAAEARQLRGDTEVAVSLIHEAGQRAQQLEHVWFELRAHELARQTGTGARPTRLDALATRLRERNPSDPERIERVIQRWFPA